MLVSNILNILLLSIFVRVLLERLVACFFYNRVNVNVSFIRALKCSVLVLGCVRCIDVLVQLTTVE